MNDRFEYLDGKLYYKQSAGNSMNAGDEAGWLDAKGYRRLIINGKAYLTHRIIFMMHHGYMPTKFVDHIDGNPANNRIENLREATNQQNCLNGKIRKSNSSGYKNVAWNERDGKWQVRMQIKGKAKSFGYFDDIELADLVAQEARDLHHKQYARNK